MLQSIRDRTQGWIAGVIITLLILSFALWGIHSYLGGGSANTTIAKVNDAEITKNQLSVTYERLRRQMQMQNQNQALPAGMEAQLKQRALQTLISMQLLQDASLSQNYRVSEKQVDNLLESMPDFQIDNQFSISRFQQVLSVTLYSAADFLQLLKTSLLIDQPRLGLILTSFALPSDVNVAAALVNQQREIKYATISMDGYLKQITKISQEKIENYYHVHQNDFKTPEQVSVEYIDLSLNDIIATIHPSDANLISYYKENLNSFSEPKQWKLEALLIPVSQAATNKEITEAQARVNEVTQKIKHGEDFNNLARSYPIGKIGEKIQANVTLNQVPQELQKSVLELTNVGQVSNPVRIENGFVILKAVQIQEGKALPFEKVKDKVKDVYVHQEAEEKFAGLRDKLANLTYEHPESLQTAAQNLGLTIKSSELFSKDNGNDKDVSKHQHIREAAFSNDVVNLKNNSDVIMAGNDTAIVLRLKSHLPASLLSLQSVEKIITEKLKIEEATEKTKQAALEIKAKLAQGANTDQVAEYYHFSWSKPGYIERHATQVPTAILNQAFAMPRPKQASLASYSIVKVPSGYSIVALSGVRDGELDNHQAKYDVFSEQIQNSQGLLDYELYKYSIIKQAKIHIEDQQIQEPVNNSLLQEG